MKNWRVTDLGVLSSLDRKKAEEALDFVTERRGDLVRTLVFAWGLFLLMTFTLIATVRLALAL